MDNHNPSPPVFDDASFHNTVYDEWENCGDTDMMTDSDSADREEKNGEVNLHEQQPPHIFKVEFEPHHNVEWQFRCGDHNVATQKDGDVNANLVNFKVESCSNDWHCHGESGVVMRKNKKGGVNSERIVKVESVADTAPVFIDLTDSPSNSPPKKKRACGSSALLRKTTFPTRALFSDASSNDECEITKVINADEVSMMPTARNEDGSSSFPLHDTDSLTISDTEDEQTDCYNSDPRLPIYSRTIKGLSMSEVFSAILFDKHPACSVKPTGVEETATFIVSLDGIHNVNDLRADDLGVWLHCGIPKTNHRVTLHDATAVVTSVNKSVVDNDIYTLHRLYNRHQEEETFRRNIYIAYHKGKLVTRAIVQYYFVDGKKKPIQKARHGNAVGSFCRPHIRTAPSTIGNLKSKVNEKKTAKEAIHEELQEAGGIVCTSSMSEEPKNRRQVYNLKANMAEPTGVCRERAVEPSQKAAKELKDNLFELSKLVQEHKLLQHRGFVRDLNIDGGISVLLTNMQQLVDLERFCSVKSNMSCPIGIDPTFDFGPYYATVITYKHLLLRNKDGNPPVAIGPVFLHQKKETESYYDFFRCMLKHKSQLSNIKAIGCDGEVAIINASIAAFPSAIILRCSWHFKNNVKDKLRGKFGANDVNMKVILRDIFGYHNETSHYLGLVDAQDSYDFDHKYQSLEEKWEEIVPGFHSWFKKKTSVIKESMITSVREAAGLGSPPATYTNNSNEGINSVMRRMASSSKMSWTEMAGLVEKLVNQQQTEFERAMYNAGEFRLAPDMPEVLNLHKSSTVWHRMTSSQKHKLIDKFNSMQCPRPVHSIATGDDGKHDVEEDASNVMSTCRLSVTAVDCGITSVNAATLDDIWKKAERVLSLENGITQAPGPNSSCKCVVSLQSLQDDARLQQSPPHFVFQDGVIFKCNCELYKALRFCHHSIGVAERSGVLKESLAHLRKKQQPASIDKLLENAQPKSAGRKPNSNTRKRKPKRNGGSPQRIEVLPAFSAASSASRNGSDLPPASSVSGNGALSAASSVSRNGSALPPASSASGNGARSSLNGNGTTFHDPSSTDWLNYYDGQPFQVTFLAGLIRKCYGCNRDFTDNHRRPPKDLILKKLDYRYYKSPITGEITKSTNMQNTYYHLSVQCVRRKYPLFETKHLIVHDEMVNKLLPGHLNILGEFKCA